MVRQWQEFFYERRYAATPLLSPDFVKIAEAYGLAGKAITARAEVGPAIDAARRHAGTAILEFRVEQEDTVYPMVPAGADLHAMIRRPSPLVETAEDA
jgi:acetolactate synthase-1/2/3 large subunit